VTTARTTESQEINTMSTTCNSAIKGFT